MIVLPYLGVLIYLIAEHDGHGRPQHEADAGTAGAGRRLLKSVARQRDPVEQIAKGKQLLDSGAIPQAEFDSLKAKALA